jgi:hypothetical protein
VSSNRDGDNAVNDPGVARDSWNDGTDTPSTAFTGPEPSAPVTASSAVNVPDLRSAPAVFFPSHDTPRREPSGDAGTVSTRTTAEFCMIVSVPALNGLLTSTSGVHVGALVAKIAGADHPSTRAADVDRDE